MNELKNYQELKVWFIEALNKYYSELYQHPIINVDRVGDERNKLIDKFIATLLGEFPNVPREQLLNDYIIWILNFSKRNFGHSPVLKFMLSDSRIFTFVKTYQHKTQAELTECDTYIKKNAAYLKPVLKEKLGAFYGYSWNQIETFSRENFKYRLAWHLSDKIANLVITVPLLKLFDEVLFCMLGSNYLDERRVQSGNKKDLVRNYPYADIDFIKDIRYKIMSILNQSLLVTIGYINKTVKVGNADATYTDLMMWLNAFKYNDKEVVSKLCTITGIQDEGILYHKALGSIKQLENQVQDRDLWKLIKEGLINNEIDNAKLKLK